MLMKLDLGADAWWGIRYTLAQGDDYLVKMDVVQHGMADAGIISFRSKHHGVHLASENAAQRGGPRV